MKTLKKRFDNNKYSFTNNNNAMLSRYAREYKNRNGIEPQIK